ncbi:acyltransferase [Flavobacterium sp. AG291]|uniref:acyltransferase n=1 Tax=Flavobacterium sp. AG291 TaxID=2184000 RepID=UPI000E0BF90D|nr:acyltransferase [Flavobacterium sp. AG291]RDI11228.1 transferase family hexapeptide repeat protein [Flavobacterium sp. AG291]
MLAKKIYWQFRYNIPFAWVMYMTQWLPDLTITVKLRGFLARPFILRCGKNFQIGRDVTLLCPQNFVVGDDVFIGKGCWLNAKAGIILENEVMLAPYVVISSLQHTLDGKSFRFGKSLQKQVRIGKGTWLAANSSVKCGVTIGCYNLVGANSFVIKDSEDGCFITGVPGKTTKLADR